jgi:hypothetical protein
MNTSGAKLIGINNNPFNDLGYLPGYDKYRFNKLRTNSDQVSEGEPITYKWFDCLGNDVSIKCYFLEPGTYERAFAAEGFDHFEWVPIQLSPRAKRMFPKHY